jgi:hypothetical protein
MPLCMIEVLIACGVFRWLRDLWRRWVRGWR